MKPCRLRSLICFSLCLFTTESFAFQQSDASQQPIVTIVPATVEAQPERPAHWWQNKKWYPLIAVAGGVASTPYIGKSQTFPIQSSFTDLFYNYTANNPTETSGLFDGFVGFESDNLAANWLTQVGLDYNQSSPYSATGTLVQGADAASANTYNYHYRVFLRQLLLEGKLLYSLNSRVHPYLLAGLGAAFNKAYNYYTNAPTQLTLTRLYSNNNLTTFSYALGLGVDVNVISHLRLGVGYRFADLGKVQLGNATIDGIPVSGRLTQSHVYTNQYLAQITVTFA